MEKINFENLPSENTPINQDNLNLMQSNIEKSVVAVGKTQPSTSENVWIKKGKNLFNKNNVLNGYRFGSDGAPFADSNYCASDFIQVNNNIQYTINWNIETRECVCYYDENKTFISRNVSEKTFTTPANCKYIRASVANSSINSAQIEQGSISTTYEAYIKKEILVKNGNGVFEEFFDESDIPNVDTSRWTKTLLGYRYTNGNNVVYAGTVVASFSSGSVNFDITNLGLAERPDTVQLTANSLRYPLRYDYDNSTATRLKIEVINNGSVYSYTGNVRFSMTVYGKLA